MHKMELGKADTFPDQSAAPSTEGKVVALNTLRIPFSGYDSTLGYVLLNMRNYHLHRSYRYGKATAIPAVHPSICVPAYQNNRQEERRYDDPRPTTANTAVICHGQKTTSHPSLLP